MKLFDCNCALGLAGAPPLKFAPDETALLTEMDVCGIDQALVYHAGQRFSAPVWWNSRITTLIKSPKLFPAWAVLPPQTNPEFQPEKLLPAMARKRIKALWAFPFEHRWRLDKYVLADLGPELVKHKIPLIVKDNIMNLRNLLEAFPEMIIVAANVGPHSHERFLRPLLDAFPKLHVDTSHYIGAGLIEEFCERYGAERLLFGTAYPDNCRGGAVLQLLHADIDKGSREMIAGKNLERLLNETS